MTKETLQERLEALRQQLEGHTRDGIAVDGAIQVVEQLLEEWDQPDLKVVKNDA